MGIRISKNIGYFLSNSQYKQVLSKDYTKKIEELQDVPDDTFKKFLFNEFKNYSSSLKNEYVDPIYYQYVINNGKWNAESLITISYDYDTPKGVMFQTPELHEQHRYDNNIDFYETPNMKYVVNDFFRPIYPLAGYVYLGKDIEVMGKKITKGTVVEPQNVSYIMRLNNYTSPDKYSDFNKQLKKSKLFTPQTDPLIYLMDKTLNLTTVNEELFRTTIKPAIITEWG